MTKISAAAKTHLPLITFTLVGQWYALPVTDVLEVAAMVEVIAMPGAPLGLIGVADRHGMPLSIIDLRVVLGLPHPPIDASTLFIVAALGSRQLGLVVDEVHQVEYIPIEQVGYTLAAGKYIRGIISYKERLIQMISLGAILAAYVTGVDDERGNAG